MKTAIKFTLLVLVLGLSFTACKKKTAGEKAKTGEATKAPTNAPADAVDYVIDTSNSKIHWAGSKPNKTHTGTINISKGTLSASNNNVVKGLFEMDMTSIAVTDLPAGEMKDNLEAHLKGTVEEKRDDFFNVSKYPAATFQITKVAPSTGNPDATHNVTGNLTLKGQTKSITFPANIQVTSAGISAVTPSFKINRTEWGINFMSKSILDDIKDGFIEDDISLTINLVGKKG